MKTTLLLLTLFVSTLAFSQDNKKYESAMKRNVEMLDTATIINTLQQLANSFERIANAEKDKWLPYYYSAYAIARRVYLEENKTNVDAMLDQAQKLIDKADSLQPDNSEITTVRAYILSSRILVDPATRGAQYGMPSGLLLDKAIQLDPENPRPYLLKGTSAYYTPPAFGGGKEKAATLLQKSLDKYAAFKPADELMPHWGQPMAKWMLQQSKSE